MIPRYPEFFNDVFGPVMQPGSSSHQAGPCRLSLLALSLLGEPVVAAEFTLDPAGSFAGTFGLMNEETALVAGILGMEPDDARFFDAPSLATEGGVSWTVRFRTIGESLHPNAVLIELSGARRRVRFVGASTGGGMIEVLSVQGFPVRFDGESHVVFVFDSGSMDSIWLPDGIIDEGVSESTLESGSPSGRSLRWFKVDREPGVLPEGALLMSPILPVTAAAGRRPQLFASMAEWRSLAEERRTGLFDVAVEYEEAASCWKRERIVGRMREIRELMHAQVHAAYSPAGEGAALPFSRRDDRLWPRYLSNRSPLVGSTSALALKLALGVNAKIRGVPIVPGPMGTGGGYLYSALYAAQLSTGSSDDALLRGLFIAAGVGAIAYTRTEPTGEVIGCAGECGVCGAMAAAAITEMLGGAPDAVEHAASFAMQAAIGLPCDPIPGGYEQPCFSRIVSMVGNALSFADLALAGSDSVLPFHEALDAADAVGRNLSPELKCTSRGGCCAVPTAQRLAALFEDARKSRNPR